MLIDQPIFIDDIAGLREHILALEGQSSRKAQLWKLLKSSARSAPMNFPWFTPFVALITHDEQDIANARKVIRTYIDKLDPMSFSTGLQYHFWCFAFPHAKWSMYFQWLCTIGAFDERERAEIAQQLVQYHFLNFFYGLRTKPEPECVDNQTLSLAFSNLLTGYLFSQGEDASAMARVMYEDGLRRLPVIIGDMPASGYSGEGSSYMDCVNGPAIPLAVELLERITGEQGLLHKRFTTGGGTPYNVLRMVALEWMPGGLLLPWDNYGYQFGVRAAPAYGALKTGEKLFYDILEKECIWSYDIGTGWAYDDLVWTLIWWPDQPPRSEQAGRSWFEPEVGGAIVSEDQTRYLMQMWDPSAPVIPTRAHVNPNAVLFNGYGVPLSADGSPGRDGSPRFRFADTFRRVSFLSMGGDDEYNYGDGCGGAHSVILLDGWEGLRVFDERIQFRSPAGDPQRKFLFCDVTPIYQERTPDVRLVQRKSTLLEDSFFIVEELAEFGEEHQITSRFLLRPELINCQRGVKIQTPEGVTLHLLNLLNGDEIKTEHVTGHPARPDGCSVIVDFTTRASRVRRLFLAWISRIHAPAEPLRGFQALADPDASLDYETAARKLEQSRIVLPMNLPAYMEMELPPVKTWWYHKQARKQRGRAWLRLPVGLARPLLYLNGRPVDLSPYAISGELLAPHVPLPKALEDLDVIDIVLRTDVPVSHYEGGGDGTIGMTGGMALCYPVEEEVVQAARFENGIIHVVTNAREYASRYEPL